MANNVIRLLAIDIDGVLTDGKIYIDSNQNETKCLCFQDFDSVSVIRSLDIKLAVITGEDGAFTKYVQNKISPDYMYAGCKNKMAAIAEIIKAENISLDDVAYVGDGKYDVEVLKSVGVSFAPSDAIEDARKAASEVLKKNGGTGCLREIADYFTKQSDKACTQAADKSTSLSTCDTLEKCLSDHIEVVTKLTQSQDIKNNINLAIDVVYDCFKRDGQLLLCGNGGSAADSQHIATEFVSRFFMERRGLNAEALTVNASTLTAVSNDYKYERVFARQVEAKGKSGDVLIGISTSGTSKNVIAAMVSARAQGMKTIAFVGEKTDVISEYADIVISVPSNCTPRIQEMHITIGHIICEEVERRLFA